MTLQEQALCVAQTQVGKQDGSPKPINENGRRTYAVECPAEVYC